MTSKGVFWATAAVHCVATFAVVLTVMGWTMTFLELRHPLSYRYCRLFSWRWCGQFFIRLPVSR
jgi:hypothetical protein